MTVSFSTRLLLPKRILKDIDATSLYEKEKRFLNLTTAG